MSNEATKNQEKFSETQLENFGQFETYHFDFKDGSSITVGYYGSREGAKKALVDCGKVSNTAVFVSC